MLRSFIVSSFLIKLLFSSAWSLDIPKSTQDAGMNKYERINLLEKQIIDLSKEMIELKRELEEIKNHVNYKKNDPIQ